MKTIKIFAYALAATSGMVLTSCGSDDSASSLPPIGGYNTADEIAASDLLAYWPLNGDGKESKSGAMPTNTVGASWVEGKKGQALRLNSGFLDYAPIAELNGPNPGFTISCWAKITNQKLTPDAVSTISPLISFAGGPNANVGNLALFGNTHGLVSSDSIQMKAEYHFKKPDGVDFNGDCVNMIKMEPWMISDNAANTGATPLHAAFANKTGGQWAHIVFTYNGANAMVGMYVNGVKISNPAWEDRKGDNTLPLPIAFFTPSHPIIGALASVANGTNVDTWNAALKGDIDEIRVYKKALILADINALYQLESAGR
ncbi:LamG-like jellyroll fold domain-containing protein [Flavobacterium sp. DGU11]|uniref:LamG-like jellyroll fold domain-containing protein n=1 Tax=Flavobacterium arundinis TaxID=3139143 RepID=A0ABU9I1X3_9FLAO